MAVVPRACPLRGLLLAVVMMAILSLTPGAFAAPSPAKLVLQPQDPSHGSEPAKLAWAKSATDTGGVLSYELLINGVLQPGGLAAPTYHASVGWYSAALGYAPAPNETAMVSVRVAGDGASESCRFAWQGWAIDVVGCGATTLARPKGAGFLVLSSYNTAAVVAPKGYGHYEVSMRLPGETRWVPVQPFAFGATDGGQWMGFVTAGSVGVEPNGTAVFRVRERDFTTLEASPWSCSVAAVFTKNETTPRTCGDITLEGPAYAANKGFPGVGDAGWLTQSTAVNFLVGMILIGGLGAVGVVFRGAQLGAVFAFVGLGGSIMAGYIQAWPLLVMVLGSVIVGGAVWAYGRR